MRKPLSTALMRRFLVSVLGNILIGIGGALFKESSMGMAPCNNLFLTMGGVFGISFAAMTIIGSAFFFVVQFTLGRELINAGTLVNWFLVGPTAQYFMNLIERNNLVPDSLPVQLIVMCCGVLVLSLGCSMYQSSKLGVSPYDSLSLILSERGGYKYFWCRVLTDSLCVVSTLALGGAIGFGTAFCAFCMGPFVSFFDVHISRKLCGTEAAA